MVRIYLLFLSEKAETSSGSVGSRDSTLYPTDSDLSFSLAQAKRHLFSTTGNLLLKQEKEKTKKTTFLKSIKTHKSNIVRFSPEKQRFGRISGDL